MNDAHPEMFGGIILVVILMNVVFWAAILFPLVRILRRMGFSGWWALLVGFWPVGLWLLAYNPWPAFDRKAD
jgi:uncharacterized membrane protein YhaH (DUF805 family)